MSPGRPAELNDLSRNRNAYTLAFSASMFAIFYGWDIGLIGGILSLPSFQQYFGINNMSATERANLNGNIVSILQAGGCFGSLSTIYISGVFGRKKPLIASGLIYLVASAIQTISGIGSSQKTALQILYFSRFLGGFSLGMSIAMVPSYLSECTPKAIRGRCTGLIQVLNNMGVMLSFWVNYGSSLNVPFGQMQWRMPFAVQTIPGVLFVLLMLPQPESPRWLAEQERYDEAAKSLAYTMRSCVNDEEVIMVLEEIKLDLAGKQKMSIRKQFCMMGESKVTALRSFIPSLVMFFQQWTGSSIINYFSPEIFAGLGITGTSSGLFATGVYGAVKVVAVIITVIFGIERLGRKQCLLLGGLGQGLMMFWIGGYSAIHPQETIIPASYVSIIAVYLYAVFLSIGWGPIPWVVAGEIAPNHVRTAAMSVALGVNWLFLFMITRVTPIMLEEIKYGTYLLYGVCCVLMSAWVYFYLPETKGYALEDIRFLFEMDMTVRALEDAPCGRVFLGGKKSTPVVDMRKALCPEDTMEQPADDRTSEDKAGIVVQMLA